MKVLVSCPPMLGQIDRFRPIFEAHNVELVCPQIVQTLSEDELCAMLPDFDAWIIGDDPATHRVLEAGKKGRLKAVVKWGVGVDNVDFEACRSLGLPVSNTPNMFGEEVADVALNYIIGLARQTFWIDRSVRQNQWVKPAGISLRDKKVGLLGYGDIGQAIAKRCQAFGMELIIWDPFARPSAEEEAQYSFLPFPSGVEEVDFLVSAAALNDKTNKIINDSILTACKPGVRVVNVSRGPIIDENSLVSHLKTGHVHSAALDVFEVEPLPEDSLLRTFDQCIFGTHNGSNTVDAVIRASHEAIRLLFGFLDIELKEDSFNS